MLPSEPFLLYASKISYFLTKTSHVLQGTEATVVNNLNFLSTVIAYPLS